MTSNKKINCGHYFCLPSTKIVVNMVVASYPLSSQAPTPVEVELCCDNIDFAIVQATHTGYCGAFNECI